MLIKENVFVDAILFCFYKKKKIILHDPLCYVHDVKGKKKHRADGMKKVTIKLMAKKTSYTI